MPSASHSSASPSASSSPGIGETSHPHHHSHHPLLRSPPQLMHHPTASVTMNGIKMESSTPSSTASSTLSSSNGQSHRRSAGSITSSSSTTTTSSIPTSSPSSSLSLNSMIPVTSSSGLPTSSASSSSSSSTSSLSSPLGPHPPPSSSAMGASGGPPQQQQPCCDSGRPIMTDPITGQTICSCQYDSHLLNYQRLAASSGLPFGFNPGSGPGGPGGPDGPSPFLPPGMGPDGSFYPPGGSAFDLKENLEAWRSLPYAAAASMYYPYEGGIPGYPFPNGYGMDLNGARRKNATRETTSTLKAWLSEHRKNPYPTKGEKIMLAIITKMTLTQVSTWFANARRRLKKENKMTWSPRNRCEEDEADDAAAEKDDDRPDRDRSPRRIRDDADSDIVDIEEDSNLDGDHPSAKRARRSGSPASDLGSFSDSDASQSGNHHPNRRSSPISSGLHHPGLPNSHLHPLLPNSHHQTPSNKPRIWSIVDMAASASSKHHLPNMTSLMGSHHGSMGPTTTTSQLHPGSQSGPGSTPISAAAAMASLPPSVMASMAANRSAWYNPAAFAGMNPASAAAAAAFSPLYSQSMLSHLAAAGAAAQAENSLNRLRAAAGAGGLLSSSTNSTPPSSR